MKILKPILLAISLSMSCSVYAAKISKVTAGTGEWAPYCGEKLRGGGIASRIATAAFNEVKVEVDYDFTSWTRAMELTKQAKYDLTLAWYESDERKKSFLYTDAIALDSTHFFHLKATEFDWATIDNLTQYSIGTTRSFFYGEPFKKAENGGRIKVEKTDNEILNFKKLLRKRIDIMPVSIFVGKDTLKNNFLHWENDAITVHPKPLTSLSLHILVSKKHPNGKEIVDTFNKGLKKLKASGKYQQIIDDSF